LILPSSTQLKAGSASLHSSRSNLGLPNQEETTNPRSCQSADKGFFVQAFVLGWCACIDRIIEELEMSGFPCVKHHVVTDGKSATGSVQGSTLAKHLLPQRVAERSRQIIWGDEGMALAILINKKMQPVVSSALPNGTSGDGSDSQINVMSFFLR